MKLEHRNDGRLCWACLLHKARPVATALVLGLFGAGEAVHLEHAHQRAEISAELERAELASIDAWPCNLTPQQGAVDAPDLYVDVCQSSR